MYQTLTKILRNFLSDQQIFKYGFNLSPMYRRSTGKVIEVSEDLLRVKIKIPLSIKNKNYVGSIFGGSLFSATDPIYMIQLINILKEDYVVWDKASQIRFKRPAKEDVFAEFNFSSEEIKNIKQSVLEDGEFNLVKSLDIINKEGIVFTQIEKTIYIADKAFYKEKRKQKSKVK